MRRSLLADVMLGAAAGAAATFLMDRVTTLFYEHERKEVQRAENAARGGVSAFESAARDLAGIAGRTLTQEQRKKGGAALHWAVGISAGALFGAVRHSSRLPAGSGLAYGALFWLVMDEAGLAALGLAPGPQAFPWQTHARGLVGHLVLGAAVELPLVLADAL